MDYNKKGDMKRYQIISALNYNKALEVAPFAKSVMLMDSNPTASFQIFSLEDNISYKRIICCHNQWTLKANHQQEPLIAD